MEPTFWIRWLTQFAQQRWAASFYNHSDLARRLFRAKHPSVLMTLPTHIAISVFLAMAWSVTIQEWMAITSAYLMIEPFVRLLCQLLLRGYNLPISNVFKYPRLYAH